jgi:hypothetical protein
MCSLVMFKIEENWDMFCPTHPAVSFTDDKRRRLGTFSWDSWKPSALHANYSSWLILIYIYMNIYIIYVFIYIYVYIHICIHIYIFIYIYIFMFLPPAGFNLGYYISQSSPNHHNGSTDKRRESESRGIERIWGSRRMARKSYHLTNKHQGSPGKTTMRIWKGQGNSFPKRHNWIVGSKKKHVFPKNPLAMGGVSWVTMEV